MALDSAIKNQLQEYMTRLVNPIKLVAYVDENPASKEMIEMLEEVKSLSEKITLSKEVEEKQIMAVPTIYLNGKLFGQGRMELDEIVNNIDSSASLK